MSSCLYIEYSCTFFVSFNCIGINELRFGRGIKSLVHIVVSKSADGPSRSLEDGEVVTSTHFMA